jgi:exodeoxyribonuclease-1
MVRDGVSPGFIQTRMNLMNPTSFVFWDTETTGLQKAFHVPVEIGALVTDANLSPLREISLACRPPRYVLPEPGALVTTQRSITDLLSRTVSAYEATCRFAVEVEAVTPTCFVSYNGLSFDDPLMQHTFYRHLHDPYLMLKGGNVRVDLLKIVRAAYALGQGDLSIPTSERGVPIFKLDRVAPLNGFRENGAHSATVDARALHHLAGLLAKRTPDIWARALRVWSRKDAVRNQLTAAEVFIQFDWNWRTGRPSFKTLMPLAPGRGYAGDFVCLDLSLDPEVYAALSAEELTKQITIGTKPRPICTTRLNGVPVIFNIDDPLVRGRHSVDLCEIGKRARRLRADTGLRERILDAVDLHRDRFEEPEHAEQQLYSGGFISNHDMAVLDRFHQVAPESKMAIVDTLRDGRLKCLAERLIYEEWPEMLPIEVHRRINGEMRSRHLATGQAPWTTIASALEDIEKHLPDVDARGREILLEYRDYLMTVMPTLGNG